MHSATTNFCPIFTLPYNLPRFRPYVSASASMYILVPSPVTKKGTGCFNLSKGPANSNGHDSARGCTMSGIEICDLYCFLPVLGCQPRYSRPGNATRAQAPQTGVSRYSSSWSSRVKASLQYRSWKINMEDLLLCPSLGSSVGNIERLSPSWVSQFSPSQSSTFIFDCLVNYSIIAVDMFLKYVCTNTMAIPLRY